MTVEVHFGGLLQKCVGWLLWGNSLNSIVTSIWASSNMDSETAG